MLLFVLFCIILYARMNYFILNQAKLIPGVWRQSKSELSLNLTFLLSLMLTVTSLYFKTCQSTSGLDLPCLHRTHFTTRVSHFLDSSFVLHFTLSLVARKIFIVLNLVARFTSLRRALDKGNRGWQGGCRVITVCREYRNNVSASVT